MSASDAKAALSAIVTTSPMGQELRLCQAAKLLCVRTALLADTRIVRFNAFSPGLAILLAVEEQEHGRV